MPPGCGSCGSSLPSDIADRGQLSLSVAHNRKRELSDADLDRFITRVGAERVLQALDRFTQPRLFAAE